MPIAVSAQVCAFYFDCGIVFVIIAATPTAERRAALAIGHR